MQISLGPIRFQQQSQTLCVDEWRFVAGTFVGPLCLPLLLDSELVGGEKLVDLSVSMDPTSTQQWIEQNRIEVLNVAGPRESSARGIAQQARDFVKAVLAWNADA